MSFTFQSAARAASTAELLLPLHALCRMDVFRSLSPCPDTAYMRTFFKLTGCSTFSSIKDPENECNC